jgi:thiamine pyrophosphate enzyme TPP binding domain protein
MTVAEYIFDFLNKKGVRIVYMVSGSSAMWLTDALCRNKALRAICCHHEQAAAMAADGYGRVNRSPGACLVTIGPGATNAITGVAQAYVDSSPMFVISGQTNSKLLQRQRNTAVRQAGTQSLNLEPIVSSITKYFCVLSKPEDVITVMEEAYEAAMIGRRGPVWIDVPVDIQNQQISVEIPVDISSRAKICESYRQEDEIHFEEIFQRMIQAKKPLIMAGGGVVQSGVEDLLSKIAEECHIPVVTSRGGIGGMPTNHPWFVGRPGAYGDRASHFALTQCDFLLIIGSRLSVSTIGYYPQRFAGNAYKIMVDIDEKELHRQDVTINETICTDVRFFLNRLDQIQTRKQMEENGRFKTHDSWNAYLQQLRKKYPVVDNRYKEEVPLNEYFVTSFIAECASTSANIVVDTGSVCNVVSQSWFLKRGQKYLISGGLSCMGFWATAMGAYQSGRELIAITGDGSAQMNIQELATIKTNRIPLKLFIYQNHGYMLIRHNQHNYMNDRFLGVGPDSGVETPDFQKVAEAYGVKAYTVRSMDEMCALIPQVLEQDEPVVCQIVVRDFAPIIPRISSKVMPDGSLRAAEFDDLDPFLTKDEYEASLYSEKEN